jgi:allophanate hydrolase
MASFDTTGWTIADFAAAYDAGASVTAVITSVLDRLDELDDPAVLIGGALRDAALAQAGGLDALVADGAVRPRLFGIPVVVKDNIDVAGSATTAACPGFAYLAGSDATAVDALRRAGAVVVAKTNMDQFATGLVGTRSPYGTPRNALDPTLVPGGSSSGSGVAVARGLVPVSLGTDTAGSGRVPAAMNHIVGLKPTIGRIGTAGVVPAVRRADCVSVFALTVADAALTAACITGGDDGTTRVPRWRPGPAARPVIGMPVDLKLTNHSRTQLDAAVELLGPLGATFVDVDVQTFLDAGALLYGGPLVAERTAAVGAFLADPSHATDPVVRTIVMAGDDYLAADAYRAEYDLDVARRAFAEMCAGLTCLLLPTVPGLTTLDDVAAAPVDANHRLGTYTTFANLLDGFAIAVPLGITPDGPLSVQLIGPAWSDLAISSLAGSLQAAAAGPLGATGRAVPSDLAAPPPAGTTIVVVGAHLTGQPLNHQLTSRGGQLVRTTTTASTYRLHALDTVPPKPGLVRVETGGAPIEVEVWALDEAAFGSFVAEVPTPLCIGTVELADGTTSKGFLCESWALDGAPDITHHGGWIAYRASLATS